ncbi:multidrug transporter [Clostridium gelidum]|uniref:Multidrug transporter n=1 Tax=Clostridium gelidum TaxID=704125 RepID=A0ABM7SX31_9CLOT|nr:TolC family protein [Clostridium gelidum]BCZ44193.1 multidrug transporter [Clostridium gelidum]
MRKNINKLVAVAIGVSIMSGSAIPVFAADTTTQNASISTSVQAQTNGKSVFTLDDAITAAASNSDTLALDDKTISYQNKINDTNEDLDDARNVGGDEEDLNKDTRDNKLKQAKQQRDFDEDNLIQKTTKAYNDIVTKQMKIAKTIKLLEVKNKELNDAKLKKNLGISTTGELGDTELQIQNLQNQQKLSVNQLKDAQDSFKVLTGKDVTKFTLEQDIKYEKFKIEGSVDDYLDNIIDNYLKLNIDLLKLNKDYYDDKDHQVSEDDVKTAKTTSDTTQAPVLASGATVDQYTQYQKALSDYQVAKNAYTNKLSDRISYLTTRLAISGNQTALEINKKQLKDNLKQLYTNILSKEADIEYLKGKIELNNKKLSNAKLKYDLGMMTKSEYTKLIVDDQGSEDLDIQLRTDIDTYNTFKETIQKPWVK